MTKPWTEHLAPSQVKYMNDIIEQVPTDHGARDAFINILQALADSKSVLGDDERFIVAGDGDVFFVANADEARQFAADEERYVIDVQNKMWFCSDDSEEDSAILQHLE